MENENCLGFKVADGQAFRVAMTGDERLEHAIFENNYSRQFAGYRLVGKDLGLIKEALIEFTRLESSFNDIIRQSLTFFIIITYGKCFSKADERNVSLDKGALKDCNDQEKGLHREIMELRNQYVAHGGSSNFESNSVVLIKVPEGRDYGFRAHDNPVFMFSFKPKLQLYLSLIEKLTMYVEQKTDKAFTNGYSAP